MYISRIFEWPKVQFETVTFTLKTKSLKTHKADHYILASSEKLIFHASLYFLPYLGVYYQTSTIRLTGRDSYLIMKAYNDEPVTISGGAPLDDPIGEWVNEGQIRTASFALEKCGEIFQGKNRLLPARSPNVDWGFNKNVASGEYHYMKVRSQNSSRISSNLAPFIYITC